MRILLHLISLFFFGDPPMNTTHENVSGSKPVLPVGLDPVVPRCPFRPVPVRLLPGFVSERGEGGVLWL